MTRAIVVGGPAAGRVEYPMGRFHGDRWRIMLTPKMSITPLGEDVPAEATIDYADYTLRQFTFSETGNQIFLLAPPEWSDFEAMAELVAVYQRAASTGKQSSDGGVK